jgi:2-haloacid dehalogenase
MIKNVLLDLDDTIFDFHKAEAIAVSKTLQNMKIEPTPEVIQRYSEINLSQWKRLELGEIDRGEVKVGRYRKLFKELGVDASAIAAAKTYEGYLSIGHYFLPGAEDLLKTLSKNYRLYLVSNGTATVQKGRIGSSDIEQYFERIFISEIVGCNKPDVRFFEACFKEIPDFKKSETIIIGDSLSSDIQGGKNAGIYTLWFNPKHLPVPENQKLIPDAETDSLDKIEKLLLEF